MCDPIRTKGRHFCGTSVPDAVVIDKDRETKTIEFELRASDFIQHGHPRDGRGFIVCWENDLEAPIEGTPKILSLKEFVAQ